MTELILIALKWYQVLFILFIVNIIAYWKIFEKAGENGWKALIPIYNKFVLYDIAWGNPMYYLLELFAPLLGQVLPLFINGTFWMIVYMIVCSIMKVIFPFVLADSFNKSKMFGIGMLLFQEIFLYILAFGKSEYNYKKFIDSYKLDGYDKMMDEYKKKEEELKSQI